MGDKPLNKPRSEYSNIAFEAAPAGLIVVDKSRKILDFNSQAQELFGYAQEEVVGKQIEVLIPERHKTEHPDLFQMFFENPAKRLMGTGRELYAQRKDGNEFPIEIGLAPFQFKEQAYVVAMVIDITEKRIAERKEGEQIKKVRALYKELSQVSSPMLEVWSGVMILPLIGTLDSRRAQNAMEKALTAMQEQKARILIIDITGVLAIDTMVADALLRLAAAIRLMGGESILTGISPDTAHSIVKLGVDLSNLQTRGSLSQGLQLAIQLTVKSGDK